MRRVLFIFVGLLLISFSSFAVTINSPVVVVSVRSDLSIQIVSAQMICQTDNIMGEGDARFHYSETLPVKFKKVENGYQFTMPELIATFKTVMRSFQGCWVSLLRFKGADSAGLPLEYQEHSSYVTLAGGKSAAALAKSFQEVSQRIIISSRSAEGSTTATPWPLEL